MKNEKILKILKFKKKRILISKNNNLKDNKNTIKNYKQK